MPQKFRRPLGNSLLDTLDHDTYERLRPDLEPISFSLGEVIYEPGTRVKQVYFPTTLNEFRSCGQFQRLLLRYTHSLLTQISQTAVCNRLHPVEQRLCRWLLMVRDRTESDDLQMTQEFIANMLGVRREGVTHAAHGLQKAGLIRYVRGHIKVLDREGLEAGVCECYEVVRGA